MARKSKKRNPRLSRQLVDKMLGDIAALAEVASLAAGSIGLVAMGRPREWSPTAAEAQFTVIQIAAEQHQKKVLEIAEFARMIRGKRPA